MNKLLHVLYRILFGDVNGIQVFWTPGALIYLINSTSILAALTSALSFRIHYMPLFVFLIVFFYVLFMILKFGLLYGSRRDILIDEFISLNITVLGLFLISLIIYAISAFMLYFYGIDGTLKPILLMLFKLYTSLIIFYHYLMSLWLKPFYARHYGRNRAHNALKAWLRNNIISFCRYSILIMLMVLSAIKLYQLAIGLLLTPIIEGIKVFTGIDLQLRMTAFHNLSDVLVNIGVLLLALLLSNILFYPFVIGVNKLAAFLFPIKSEADTSHA